MATSIMDVFLNWRLYLLVINTSNIPLISAKNERMATANPPCFTIIHSTVDEHSTYFPDPPVPETINIVDHKQTLEKRQQLQENAQVTK